MELSFARKVQKFDIVIVAVLFLVLAPLLTVQRTTDFMIFCIFVLAYDLIYGYMGRLSFGHMLYLGIGAYGAALSAEHFGGNPFLALAVAVAAGAVVSFLLGMIVVRTTGACFALINLAFNQVGYFMALIAFAKWTGGEDGMAALFDRVWLFDISNRSMKFGFVLASLLGVFFLVKRLTDSSFGILLRSIRENETRARFLGYNTYLYKLLAFVLSASLAAFAGALTILNYTYATPSFIDPTRNVEVIFACLIGGAGNIYGALLGGIGYMIISNYLPNYIQRWEMFLGIALLVLVFRFKAGLWGYLKMLILAKTKGVQG